MDQNPKIMRSKKREKKASASERSKNIEAIVCTFLSLILLMILIGRLK